MSAQHDPFGESFNNWQYTGDHSRAHQVKVLLTFIKQNCGSKEFDDFLKDDVAVQLAMAEPSAQDRSTPQFGGRKQANYLCARASVALASSAVEPGRAAEDALDFALAAKALAEAASVLPADLSVRVDHNAKPV